MMLLSSIINKFARRFLDRYKDSILPSHKKALQAMKHCRYEHGPHMLHNALIITAINRFTFYIPEAIEIVPIAGTMKITMTMIQKPASGHIPYRT